MSIILGDPSHRKFARYAYKKEEELEREAKKHFQEIFGSKVTYLDVKPKLYTSLPGISIGAIPDGFALDLTDTTSPVLLLIEYELLRHEVFGHISNQIVRFEEILEQSKASIFNVLKSYLKSDTERMKLHDAIWNQQPHMVVIIDRVDPTIKRVAKRFNVTLVEFQTFSSEPDNLECEHFHLFSPVRIPISVPEGRYGAFFEAVTGKLKSNLKKEFRDFKSTSRGNILQIWYKGKSIHYEVWIKRGKLIEVGLHFETSRRKSLEMMNQFKEQEEQIELAIPNVKFDDDWGPRTHWCRIYEELSYSRRKDLIQPKPGLVEQVGSLMTKYIETLQPYLESA